MIISKAPNRQSKDKNLEKERFEIDRKPRHFHNNYMSFEEWPMERLSFKLDVLYNKAS